MTMTLSSHFLQHSSIKLNVSAFSRYRVLYWLVLLWLINFDQMIIVLAVVIELVYFKKVGSYKVQVAGPNCYPIWGTAIGPLLFCFYRENDSSFNSLFLFHDQINIRHWRRLKVWVLAPPDTFKPMD